MSSPQPTNSPDERGSPATDSADAPGSDSRSGIGGASWRRNASWLVPCMIALLVFLFGDNVTDRFVPADAPGDGSAGKPGGDPAEAEDRFHATYSFRTAPFIHPKIVGDLVGSLADAGDQVVAINLLDSQDSNRYYGEIFVTPQTDPLVPSWPWLYALDGEPYAAAPPGSIRGQELFAYRYVGSTPSGLDVLHYTYSGGGSGLFSSVVFVRIESDVGVDYGRPAGVHHAQGPVGPEIRRRELIRMVGRIPLGDRWQGTIEVVGNDVVVRGRDLAERCEVGGVSVMEAVEMDYFMDVDCKEGDPESPPLARVYEAPARH